MSNIFEGEKIRLRAVEPGDWEIHFAWDQDTDSARAAYYIPFPNSTEYVKSWTANQAQQSGDHNRRMQIETVAAHVFVGTINAHSADQRTGTFSYGLAILPEHRRKGYATEAIFLLLRYFFLELRYQKVNAQAYSFNTGSIKLHERFGFQQEGRLRRMVYTDGQFHDELVYGMTREEFYDLHLGGGPDAQQT